MKLRSGTLLEEISPTITLNKNDKITLIKQKLPSGNTNKQNKNAFIHAYVARKPTQQLIKTYL